jgi:hypothetical protein
MPINPNFYGRYHKYASLEWCTGNCILIIFLGLSLTFAYAPAKLEKLMFCSAYFYSCTAILKFDSFSLSYHIVRTRIAKVTASFSLFALSELVCTKKVPYPIHYSLLIYPKLILLWRVTYRQTDGQHSSPLVP